VVLDQSTKELLALQGIDRIVENFNNRRLLRFGERAQAIRVGSTEANGRGVSWSHVFSVDDL